MLLVMGDCAALANTDAGGGYVPRPDSRAPTRFEKRGVGRGHVVRDLLWQRRRS
jgi:tRNA (guanine-N7-)-methyltransferase